MLTKLVSIVPSVNSVLIFCPSRQADLRKVLKAYAMHNEKTGYCQVRTSTQFSVTYEAALYDNTVFTILQAMAPVAATLLMNMTAEVQGRKRNRTCVDRRHLVSCPDHTPISCWAAHAVWARD